MPIEGKTRKWFSRRSQMPIKFDQSVNNVVIGKASLIQKIRGVLGLS